MSAALIVFAKRPNPGAVKTRLTPPLSEEEAADLYRAFVADTLAQYMNLDADIRLYLTGKGECQVGPNVCVLEQRSGSLGERMVKAFDETFAKGYQRAVIIGTDHPTLPIRIVQDALATLDGEHCVTIGPAEDGGFYLLGMTRPRPELFRQMTYSHDRVFEETLARAQTASVTVLPAWYDVDRPDELTRLYAELRTDPSPAPRTYANLQELAHRHSWLRD